MTEQDALAEAKKHYSNVFKLFQTKFEQAEKGNMDSVVATAYDSVIKDQISLAQTAALIAIAESLQKEKQ